MDLVALGGAIHWTKETSTGSALLWMIGDGIEATDMKAFLERVVIVIATATETETGTGTGTVNETEIADSMGGMEGSRRMDHLVEETITEGAYQAETIAQGLVDHTDLALENHEGKIILLLLMLDKWTDQMIVR